MATSLLFGGMLGLVLNSDVCQAISGWKMFIRIVGHGWRKYVKQYNFRDPENQGKSQKIHRANFSTDVQQMLFGGC